MHLFYLLQYLPEVPVYGYADPYSGFVFGNMAIIGAMQIKQTRFAKKDCPTNSVRQQCILYPRPRPTTPARAARTYNPAHNNTHHCQPYVMYLTPQPCLLVSASFAHISPLAPIPVHHTILFRWHHFDTKGV